MLTGALCATLAACAMIGWNVAAFEKEHACRPHHRRHRLHGRRRRRKSVLFSGRRHNPSSEKRAIPMETTIFVNNTDSDQSHVGDSNKVEAKEGKDVDRCSEAGDGLGTARTTPNVKPSSAGQCQASRATAAAVDSDEETFPPEDMPPPVLFNDLVLILDAPPLPPPPWKLPKLPEEIDMSSSTDMTLDGASSVSSPKECDLCPEFHLSAPWSPRARGNTVGFERRRSSTLGNRPRTFSEYSAGPYSSTSSTSPAPRLHKRCSTTGAGLLSVKWGAQTGEAGMGGGFGEAREGLRTRSFTYGSSDHVFAD